MIGLVSISQSVLLFFFFFFFFIDFELNTSGHPKLAC